MSKELKSKLSQSEEMYSAYALQTNENTLGVEPGKSYEIFRNNTTAVEVIVKEVPRKSVKKLDNVSYLDYKVKSLQEDVDRLKRELNIADMTIERTKTGFRSVLCEMKKQLDNANQREFDAQAKNLSLQLENEKLTTLLESKAAIINKLKNELQNMKRTLKFVVKSITYAPKIPESFNYSSDPEYNEFENSLKKDIRVKFANAFDVTGTFDSSISKEIKNSFDH